MRGELFVPVEDYPSYEVSNYGRVRTVRTGRILALARNRASGWYFVCLRKAGGSKTIPVHRLVAQAFLEEPEDPDTSIIQRDGDRSNNRVDNLVWKPRWFAVRYMREMSYPQYHRHEELVSEKTGEVFDSVAHVASVVMSFPSVVFAGIYSENDITSYPTYGRIARPQRLFHYTHALRGL